MTILDESSEFRMWGEKWKKRVLIGATYLYTHDINSQLTHIYQYVGDVPINEIRLMELDDMMIELANLNPNTNKPMAKKTLKSIKNTVVSVFNYAIDNSNLDRNPAKNMVIPKKAVKEERNALTLEEMNWLIDTPHRCRTAALIMMFCGLRLGETIPLQWSDIDYEKSLLTVSKSTYLVSANTYGVKRGTKNGKERTVPIPDILLNVLKEEQKNSQSRYICPKNDLDMQTPTSWRRLWQSYFGELNRKYCNNSVNKPNKYCPQKTKVTIDKITPHRLRHTYATLLYSSGVDLLTAKELLGHSDVSTTLKIYTHLEKTVINISIKKLEIYIFEHFEGKAKSENSENN